MMPGFKLLSVSFTAVILLLVLGWQGSDEKSHGHTEFGAVVTPDTVDSMGMIISDNNNTDEHKHAHE